MIGNEHRMLKIETSYIIYNSTTVEITSVDRL